MTRSAQPLSAVHWRHAAPIFRHPYRGYERLHRRFGPTVAIDRPGRKPLIFTMDEELAGRILIDHQDALKRPQNIVTGIFRNLVGDGIVSAEGEQWQGRRRRGNQRIRGATLEDDQVDLLRLCLSELRDDVRSLAGQGIIDLLPAIERFTLSASIRLVCSYTLERGPEFEAIYDAVQRVMVGTQRIADIRRQMFLYSLLPRSRRWVDAPQKRAIGPSFDRLAAFEPDSEARELLIATYENPSTALSWTLSLLGARPEELAKIRDEVATLDVVDNPELVIADIEGLERTGATIRETLRLRPPIAYLSRRVTQDIEIDDLLLERGSHVLVVPYCLHHNPERWPAPERYMPERFIGDGEGLRGGRLWSFGVGARACPGTRLALQLATAALAVIAREARWTQPVGRAPMVPTGRFPWNEKSPCWQRLVLDPAPPQAA